MWNIKDLDLVDTKESVVQRSQQVREKCVPRYFAEWRQKMCVVESDSATPQSSWCARGAELEYGSARGDESFAWNLYVNSWLFVCRLLVICLSFTCCLLAVCHLFANNSHQVLRGRASNYRACRLFAIRLLFLPFVCHLCAIYLPFACHLSVICLSFVCHLIAVCLSFVCH